MLTHMQLVVTIALTTIPLPPVLSVVVQLAQVNALLPSHTINQRPLPILRVLVACRACVVHIVRGGLRVSVRFSLATSVL